MSDTFIPYGRQSIDENDIAAVLATLQSEFLTQGPKVPAFEQALCARCDATHAVAVNSATSALHIACLALGLKPGGLLWTVPNTFVASANCGLYCGAEVDFVDIDPQTWCLSTQSLADKLEKAARAKRLPDIVVAVDFAGQPCDRDALADLKAHYGFRLIADAAHALGAQWRGQPVGGAGPADITVFSFHPVKIIATGEGGMALTQDDALARRLALSRSHGITRDAADFHDPDQGDWYYEQHSLGFNYRMTELQAALGISQLARLDAFLARRRALAARYDRLLADLPVIRPRCLPQADSAWHLYAITLRDPAWRRPVFDSLRAAGIGVQIHYIPVHLQPYFQAMGFRRGDFPQAESYYARTLSLPLFPDLSETQQDRVVACLRQALSEAGA